MLNNKSLNIRIPETQYNNMKTLANAKGVSISDIAREIFNNSTMPMINTDNINRNFNNCYAYTPNYNSSNKDCINYVSFK